MNLFFLERKAKMLFPRGDAPPHRRGSHAGKISGRHQQLRLVRFQRFGGLDRLGPPGESSFGQPLVAPFEMQVMRSQPLCLVRVTHPFHPLSGRQFACVGERYNRYGKRLLLRVDDVTVRSIPPQWTDLVPPDPEIVMGGNRALFRVADLLELAKLVEELSRRKSSSGSNVRRTMPHV